MMIIDMFSCSFLLFHVVLVCVLVLDVIAGVTISVCVETDVKFSFK